MDINDQSSKKSHVTIGGSLEERKTIASFDYVGDFTSVTISRGNSGDYFITHSIDSESTTSVASFVEARCLALEIAGFDQYCDIFYPPFIKKYPDCQYLGSAVNMTEDGMQHLVQTGKSFHILSEYEDMATDKHVGKAEAISWVKENESTVSTREFSSMMKALCSMDMER